MNFEAMQLVSRVFTKVLYGNHCQSVGVWSLIEKNKKKLTNQEPTLSHQPTNLCTYHTTPISLINLIHLYSQSMNIRTIRPTIRLPHHFCHPAFRHTTSDQSTLETSHLQHWFWSSRSLLQGSLCWREYFKDLIIIPWEGQLFSSLLTIVVTPSQVYIHSLMPSLQTCIWYTY